MCCTVGTVDGSGNCCKEFDRAPLLFFTPYSTYLGVAVTYPVVGQTHSISNIEVPLHYWSTVRLTTIGDRTTVVVYAPHRTNHTVSNSSTLTDDTSLIHLFSMNVSNPSAPPRSTSTNTTTHFLAGDNHFTSAEALMRRVVVKALVKDMDNEIFTATFHPTITPSKSTFE